jgi:hypothetical protein
MMAIVPEPVTLKTERKWAVAVTVAALLLTLIPYLVGMSFAGDRKFLWLGYNLDDSCVYLSWMKQAATGSSHALNMFTVDAQHGMSMNPLFLMMGGMCGVLHLPLIGGYHLFRVLFAAGMLGCTWLLIEQAAATSRQRKLAFLFVCFSAGFGWLPGLWPGPIDAWQPEAITYLSLYLSPLFAFSLALQALSAALLLKAIRRGGSTGIKCAAGAGGCVFLLGLTHTYDVITMYAAFTAIALTTLASSTALFKRAALYSLFAGAIALPAVLYIYHELQVESVFHARMEVKTASGPFINLILGLGLPLLLAVGCAVLSARKVPAYRNQIAGEPERVRLALAAWLVANIAVSYLPVASFPFQRKMLQGVHIPVAILGGVMAADLIKRYVGTRSRRICQIAGLAMVLLTIPSNLRFMLRDMESYEIDQIQTTHMHRPYISSGEEEALAWLEKNTGEHDAIQPIPWVASVGSQFAPVDMTMACLLPGAIHRKVYCGHWGETPDYQSKLGDLIHIGMPPARISEAAREELVKSMHVKYLVFSQKQAGDASNQADDTVQRVMPLFTGGVPLPQWMKLAYSNKAVDIYKIDLP